MNYPLLKSTLKLPVAIKWLIEDSKDDFFPDVFNFREISEHEGDYLVQREHKFLQIESYQSRMEYVPKSNGMLREAIWLHPNHRLLYLACLQHLLPKIDRHALKTVYSYRKDSEGPDDYPFANRASRWKDFHNDFRKACLDESTQAVLLTDIASFYDHISIDSLCNKIESMLGNTCEPADKEVIALLRRLLHTWSTSDFGIPQNLDPSSFFASIYLHMVDSEMESARFNYFRWVDDIRICAKSKQQAFRALHHLQKEMAKERFFLASDKTRIVERGSDEFNSLVDVEDDVLISQVEEALSEGIKSNLERVSEKCLVRVDFHATKEGDDRKFRAFCNRLLDCTSFTELRPIIEPKVISLVLPRLTSHVARSDYWAKMLAISQSEEVLTEIERLLVSKEKSLFDWQRFHLWRLLTNYQPPFHKLDVFIKEAKSIATSHVSELEAAQAIVFIGKHGTNVDREALFSGHFSSQQSFIIQRSVLIAIQALPHSLRESFYKKAVLINSEHKQLIAYLEGLQYPNYGRKLRYERKCAAEPKQISVTLKRGVGLVQGQRTVFRLSRVDMDYE